jgi:hypothetical protein
MVWSQEEADIQMVLVVSVDNLQLLELQLTMQAAAVAEVKMETALVAEQVVLVEEEEDEFQHLEIMQQGTAQEAAEQDIQEM